MTIGGCKASLEVNPDGGGYYEMRCDEDGCVLVPHPGTPPADAELLDTTEEGYGIYQLSNDGSTVVIPPTPIVREPIIPSELPNARIEYNGSPFLGYTKDGVPKYGPEKTIRLQP